MRGIRFTGETRRRGVGRGETRNSQAQGAGRAESCRVFARLCVLELALFLVAAALGQEAPAKPEQATAPKPDTAAQAKPDAGAPATSDAGNSSSPAPSSEQWLTGSFDFGYRWLTGIHGSLAEYRSVVNLGEGPKLFGVEFSILDPKKRLFDRLNAWGYSWGGDPYNTAHVDARKQAVYDFRFDYQKIAYFNAVPSFANPLAPGGGGFNQQSFDIYRRNISAQIDFRPGHRIIPYVAFERNSGFGPGIETWVNGASNEYPVPVLYYDATNNYRGGVRFEFNRFHLTLEQGGTTFKDDNQATFSGVNFGARLTPIGNQTLVLNGLYQAYGIRGQSIYSRGLFAANPVSWMDVYGQLLFSQPKTDVHFTELAQGNFAAPGGVAFYSGQSMLATGAAKLPHVTGNAGFELRPWRRLRIVESWMTDRYHDVPTSLVATAPLPSAAVVSSFGYPQFVNYNQQQTDVLFDLTPKITLRGGYRRVWGDATVLAGQLSQLGNLESGKLERNIGLATITFRLSQKLTANVDYDGASSDHIYFRANLNDYHKGRVRLRYQPLSSLWFQTNFEVFENENPAPDIRLYTLSRRNAVSVYWTPAGGKRFSISCEYDRSTYRSDIRYLDLFLTPTTSSYRDYAHTATAAADVGLPRLKGAKLTAGGSLFVSSGSRPTTYYQPLIKLLLPVTKHVAVNTQWRYYGFGETFYWYERFRTNVFETGLRVTR